MMDKQEALTSLRNLLEGKDTAVTGNGELLAGLIEAGGQEAVNIVLDNTDRYFELLEQFEELARFPELTKQACEWHALDHSH